MNFPNFIGPAYTARSPNQDSQRCVNLYLEKDESGGGKSPAMLVGTPGLTRFTTLATAGVRGLYTASGGRCFAVSGTVLYELAAGGTATARGTLVSTTGPVSMSDNGLQVIIVDGTTAGYLLTLGTNTFAAITDDAFYGADRVSVFDNYFVLNRPGTQQLYISGLLDGAAYDGTDFASAESSPDLLVALEVERRELLLLGTRSGEVWFDAGTVDFPFAPISGTAFPFGCAAPHSLRTLAGQFYWLAADKDGQGLVMCLEGYAPQRISTFALEFAIQNYSRIDDAIGYTMQREGHSWYILSFPSGNATWAFDAATKMWFELADLDSTTGLLIRHRVEHHCYAFNKHLVAGEQDGRVYESSYSVFDQDGDALVRERTAPHIHNDRKLLYFSVLEVDLETGVGLDAGVIPGSDPQLMMQFSDDGGHTWSQERWVSAGKLGAYHARAIWRRLGRARQRAYRIRISDPVRVVLLAARLEGS